jgi:hypothetical protein
MFTIAQSIEQALAQQLEESFTQLSESYREPTRQELIDKLNDLRASGSFKNIESLYGKYANSNVPEMSEEDFHASLHEIATGWQQEFDGFATGRE